MMQPTIDPKQDRVSDLFDSPKAQSSVRRAILCYVIAVVICIAALTAILQLWKADLDIPFSYYGAHDTYLNSMFIKMITQKGLTLHNPNIGAPTGTDLEDYPFYDMFHLFMFKFLSFFTNKFGRILNVYFLLTFPFTTISALFVFRKFEVSEAGAIFGSLIYTFLPYHFLHGENHIFLAAYYVVPLIVMMLIWLAKGETLFDAQRFITKSGYLSIAICVITGLLNAGLYYSFFTGYFLLVVALFIFFRIEKRKNLKPAIFLMAILAFTSAVNVLPSILYGMRHGVNRTSMGRDPLEAETFSLKITELMMPITDHRLPVLSNIKKRYFERQNRNEGDAVTLGIIGSCGFALLLFRFIFLRAKQNDRDRTFAVLELLNISALLLGTTAGFSSLFSFIISPMFRAYARIGIFIGFFCIFAAVLVLERIKLRFSRPIQILLLGLLLVIGLLDQTTTKLIPNYEKNKREFENDRDFVQKLEASVPAGSMIMQLPIATAFPNPGGTYYSMMDYDFFRGYLHSDDLRWTYGAMRGRDTDFWQKTLSDAEPERLAKTISYAGFSGIYLDRFGYPERSYEQKLSQLLQQQPLISRNQRFIFFSLLPYAAKLKSEIPSEEWNRRARNALVCEPIVLRWDGGFSTLERVGDLSWRWLQGNGSVELENRSPHTKRIGINMLIASVESASELWIQFNGYTQKLKLKKEPPLIHSIILTLPPGTSRIDFVSDSAELIASNPGRRVYRIFNFRLINVEHQDVPLQVANE
jgi:hypothetical protein